ncbi:MAG TPA: hypothetical protein VHV51_11125 [Polyangiaceae bacterium]|nr:hypothetical protein [Polyangiaceae bacterium]
MLRTLALVVSGFGFVALVGCSASSPDNGNGERTSSSGASSGGTTSGSAGSGGAPSGSAGTNVGGNSNAGSGGASGGGGSAGSTGVSAGAGGTSSAGAGGTSSTLPLFSDDFEAPMIDMTKWTPRINSQGMFSIDTSQKHGGNQSLHVMQNGFSTMLAKEGAPVFPAPSNHYYARLWIRVSSGGTGMLPTGHVSWIESGDVTNDTHELRVGANLGYFQSNLWPGDTDIRDPMAAMTTDAWHCIQIEYGNDLLNVSLDGVKSSISTTNWVAANSANGSNTTPKSGWSPTYAAFRIGWELGGPADAWYDDVALDYSPIACN